MAELGFAAEFDDELSGPLEAQVEDIDEAQGADAAGPAGASGSREQARSRSGLFHM